MICYVFPLADEAKDFLSHCTEKESFSIGRLRVILSTFQGRRVVVALTGMGMKLAEQNVEVLLNHFRLKAIILAGYGGALVPQLKLGDIALSDNYSSPEILPFVRLLNGFQFCRFYTTNEVVSTMEKKGELARSYSSQVVDMETSVIAKSAYQRRVPFVAIRAISDEYSQALPAGALAASYNPELDTVTPLKLFFYLLTHPWEFVGFQKFVRGLPKARKSLTTFLIQITDEFPKHW